MGDYISERNKFVEQFLTYHPSRQDLPIMEYVFWGTPSSEQLKAQAIVGIRLTLKQWFFWWYNLDGEFEPDESNPFKDVVIDWD